MTDLNNQDIIGRETETSSTWILLQIADSVFPTGGFSHSFGFESATKHGFVTDFNGFKAFVLSSLQNAELDGILQAYLSNHVANRASFRQGNSLLVTACKTFGNQEMTNLQGELENKRLYGHFATMFGFMCGVLKLSLVQTQQLFLFSTLRTVIASAVRLGNIGPLQAQSIQFEMQKTAEKIRKKFEESTVEEATTTAPVADFLQGAHDNLFSKLFYS
ncbi:hypothetical protein OS493_003947 [Desmophyllum pertusum]|uniref:Urease accessory protein UreF n=1 Tax=Desmophyllum pertusum TaxID=174260 RepID=A0A9X0D4W4_9CNID|nr:hypothetical protein OS493_003947 [Desmophyllum pertusum]